MPYSTPQVIALPVIEMAGQHCILHQARCPQCGRITKAPIPTETPYGYGPRLSALIGELSGSQRSSRSAVQEVCGAVLGIPLSRGAMQRIVERVSEAIRPHYERIAVSPVVHESTM